MERQVRASALTQVPFDFRSPDPLTFRGLTAGTRATSRAAAQRIAPTVTTIRGRVLDYVRSRGTHGATDEEIQRGVGLEGSTQRPRRVELYVQGWITDSGQRRVTASGRRAVVWLVNG
jgi:hypothetical protein